MKNDRLAEIEGRFATHLWEHRNRQRKAPIDLFDCPHCGHQTARTIVEELKKTGRMVKNIFTSQSTPLIAETRIIPFSWCLNCGKKFQEKTEKRWEEWEEK